MPTLIIGGEALGWLEERIDDDGRTRYIARYRDIRGRKRSAGSFTTERQANRAWQRAEADIDSGRMGDPRRGRQSFETYVRTEWLPNHVVELTTREGYIGQLERYILPEFGPMRMIDILPSHVREWILGLQTVQQKKPPTIRQCKVILDAILTTALNDQIVFLHAGKGVKTPPIAKKPKRIVTVEQFDQIYRALDDETMRLLVETEIETGLRWGELTELRPKDIDFASGVLTVARVVVQRRSKLADGEEKFVIKHYPKDKEWRQLRLAPHLLEKLKEHIATGGVAADGLLFELQQSVAPRRRSLPDRLPNPDELGWTDPNSGGHRYRHGTTSGYGAGGCRCQHCKNAIAAYRAARRFNGLDQPRSPRSVITDGHIGNDWFRRNVWNKATAIAQLPIKVTPHALRHAHASWLLAGGADLQVVKERLGHGSITTTEQYLHTLPGAGESALKALSAFRNASTGTEIAMQGRGPGLLDLLRQLAALHDSGVLERTEFELKKTELLSRI